MTDEQIIKALKCCANDSASSNFILTYQGQPLKLLLDNAFDLINRQKAEIESNKAKIKISAECIARQDKEIERLQTEKENLRCVIEDLCNNTEIAKAEAVKEFAERLKKSSSYSVVADGDREIPSTRCYGISELQIDNLVKEMVGAESG